MSRNTAILKTFASLTIVGAATGATIYVHKNGVFKTKNEMLEDESITKFLIVKSVALNATEAEQGEIYIKKFLFDIQKKFKCRLTGGTIKEDESCEIYKLSDKEKKLAKAITNNLSANSTNIKAKDNFFKVKISNHVIDAITNWESENHSINVISTNETENQNKKFAKLIPIYLVDNNKIIKRKTSVLFAKTVNNIDTAPSIAATNSEIKNYKCKIETKAKEFDCTVIDVNFDANKKTVSVPLSSATKTLTSADLQKKDKYFAVEVEQEYLDLMSLNHTHKINVVTTKTDETNKKYGELKPMFKILDKEVKGKENYWMVKLSAPASENVATDDNWITNYKECQIGNSETKIKCEFYKTGTTTPIDFSKGLTKITKHSEIPTNKVFLIKFTDNLRNIKNVDYLQNGSKVTLISSDKEKVNYFLTAESRLFIEKQDEKSTDKITVTGAFLVNL